MIANAFQWAGQCVLVGLYLVCVLAWIDRVIRDRRSHR